MAITADLTTVVRNISGKSRVFGCLPRSKRLESGEEFTIDGPMLAMIAGNRRKLQGLHRALHVNRSLVIVSGPNSFLYDTTRDETKVLRLLNGTLGVTDPSFGEYSSSMDEGTDGV